MIKYINGNLLNLHDIDIIAHQVNCKGVMGSGIAEQVKRMYPKVYEYYREICKAEVQFSSLLGRCHIVATNSPNKPKYVVNLFGQDGYGYQTIDLGGGFSDYRRQQHTDIDALETSIEKLKYFAKDNNLSVAIPYNIGCGRGGADWYKVLSMIEKVFKDYSLTIVKFEEGD